MKILNGAVVYVVTDDDEYLKVSSIDGVGINEPQADRCIVTVRIYGESVGVTRFISRSKAELIRRKILNACSLKKTSKRLFKRTRNLFRPRTKI